MNIKADPYIVFDLDDTLYKEEDFLLSAYKYIAEELEDSLGVNIYDEMACLWHQGESTFDVIVDKYDVPHTIAELVEMYRYHIPKISLLDGALTLLDHLRQKEIPLGLITDGRSITQRNKLASLGISEIFEKIVISEEIGSEKPSKENFEAISSTDKKLQYYYIGDNTRKDFITPNELGWITIGLLDDGRNIHSQIWDLEAKYLPQYRCRNMSEVLNLINQTNRPYDTTFHTTS